MKKQSTKITILLMITYIAFIGCLLVAIKVTREHASSTAGTTQPLFADCGDQNPGPGGGQ